MLGQTPKKIFFIYLAVKRYHKFRKMSRNFADFGVFFTSNDLRIHQYNFGMLNFRQIFYALSNNKKKITSRPVQRNPAFWENRRNFRIFWAFFPTTFRRIGRLFLNSYFHMGNLHCNDWQNHNKLVLLRPKKFHFWGKLTKSSDIWQFFFFPNFENNCTFVFKLLFLNENSII